MNPVRHLHATDRVLYRLVHRKLRARPLDPLMVAMTDIGTKSAPWLAVACVLALFGDRRARRTALTTTAATLSAQGLVNMVLKPLVRRRRPFMSGRLRSRLLIDPPREHSWPSGHAASSAAAFTTLAAAYPDQALPLLGLAAAIAYSRVYVGVHYPFDVAAGSALGFTVGLGYVLAGKSRDGRISR